MTQSNISGSSTSSDDEVRRILAEQARIKTLPAGEQAVAEAVEEARQQAWIGLHAGQITSNTSQAGSSTNQQVIPSQSQGTPVPQGSSRPLIGPSSPLNQLLISSHNTIPVSSPAPSFTAQSNTVPGATHNPLPQGSTHSNAILSSPNETYHGAISNLDALNTCTSRGLSSAAPRGQCTNSYAIARSDDVICCDATSASDLDQSTRLVPGR